ncbi:MAG: inverse autotransporter beta domain-containing protein [Desulfomonile sp.]|nr:inverse autotransporter beta domain-containing protein [Desulfomonile sp.]
MIFIVLTVPEAVAGIFPRPIPTLEGPSIPLDPFRPPPNPAKSIEIEWPETYIQPLARYGIDLAVPVPFRRGLSLDVGYDRWAGLPTATLDYFLPVKAWENESLFFMPRATMNGRTEGFSLGAGMRTLVGSRALFGVYTFNDWSRPRGSDFNFLKEAGIGGEISLLPGRFAELTVSANAYLPVNERKMFSRATELLIRESLPRGWDARLSFVFPALVDLVDAHLSGEAHAYRGETTEIGGYKVVFSLGTRDGMFAAALEQGKEQGGRDTFRAMGTIKLAFDWVDLLDGKNPFSAPSQASSIRVAKDLRQGLYQRVTRKHDLPTDRKVSSTTLAASVHDSEVIFSGGFPDLPNTPVTVQVAASPWRDAMEIVTDSHGAYSGRLRLSPGEYKLRLVHRETGQTSRVQSFTIRGEDE